MHRHACKAVCGVRAVFLPSSAACDRGIGLGRRAEGRAGAIADNAIQWSDHLNEGHAAALRVYGALFLEFLDAAAPMRSRLVSLPHSSKAVDRSVILHNIAPDAVMKVAAALHFVRLKLSQHAAAQLQQTGTASPAPFLIKGGANSSQQWLRKFTVVCHLPCAPCVGSVPCFLSTSLWAEGVSVAVVARQGPVPSGHLPLSGCAP